jgi:hypothetical protein
VNLCIEQGCLVLRFDEAATGHSKEMLRVYGGTEGIDGATLAIAFGIGLPLALWVAVLAVIVLGTGALSMGSAATVVLAPEQTGLAPLVGRGLWKLIGPVPAEVRTPEYREVRRQVTSTRINCVSDVKNTIGFSRDLHHGNTFFPT